MKTLEDLRELAERLPPGGAALLPREALLEALAGMPVHTSAKPATGDLTLGEAAVRFRRSTSTVRTWCQEGRFPGAYHLPASGRPDKKGRMRVGAWRIPAAAIEAFVGGHRSEPVVALDVVPPSGRRRRQLGDWRKARRA